MVGAAILLGALAIGSTGASAHGPGGFGGFPGFGIHLGGWGHGWGHGWGPGWGYRRIAFRPLLGGCYFERWVDRYGDINVRRVCY
jgi:hypothetical protein